MAKLLPQRLAAEADLIEGMSQRAVAHKHNVCLDTVNRWAKDLKPLIQEALKERNEREDIELKITADRTLAEIARIAYYNPGKRGVFTTDENGLPKIDYSGATDWDWACVQEISNEQLPQMVLDLDGNGSVVTKSKVKLYSKAEALKMLVAHQGLNAPVQVEDVTELTDEQRAERLASLRDRLRDRAARAAADVESD